VTPAPAQPVTATGLEERASNESTAAATTPEQATATDAQGSGSPSADTANAGGDEPKKMRDPDVVFVPTPQPIVDKMLDLAKLKSTDVLYDLGCGDGRIVVTAAKRYGVKAFGYDIDPQRIKEARENVRKNKLENLVTIEQKDIFTLDLSPANVVTLYLLPQLNVKLIPQLQKLKPGSRIVSHDFDMKGVKPEVHLKMHPAGIEREHEVFLWRAPIRKEPGSGG
jgi:SAM-dependent methyltransferase